MYLKDYNEEDNRRDIEKKIGPVTNNKPQKFILILLLYKIFWKKIIKLK